MIGFTYTGTWGLQFHYSSYPQSENSTLMTSSTVAAWSHAQSCPCLLTASTTATPPQQPVTTQRPSPRNTAHTQASLYNARKHSGTHHRILRAVDSRRHSPTHAAPSNRLLLIVACARVGTLRGRASETASPLRPRSHTGEPLCRLCLILAMALPGFRPCSSSGSSKSALPCSSLGVPCQQPATVTTSPHAGPSCMHAAVV
jgi:hypothetical protein